MLAVFRVHPLQKTIPHGRAFFRVKAEYSEHLVGPVHGLTACAVNGEASSVGQSLRLSQICFAASQSLLGKLLFAQIENVGDPLVELVFETRCSDQHRYSAAVLPEILFLT